MANKNIQRHNYENERYDSKEYFGIFVRDNRVCVDTKRLKKFIDYMPYLNELPKEMGLRNTHYFTPKHQYRSDYNVNNLLDVLNHEAYNWENVFLSSIKKLQTPDEVGQTVRNSYLAGMIDADDFEIADFEAMMAKEKARPGYYQAIIELRYAFLMELIRNFEKGLLCMMQKYSESFTDFKVTQFYNVCEPLLIANKKLKHKNKKNHAAEWTVKDCKHYKYYNYLSKLTNFVKHNSLPSYKNMFFNYDSEKEDKELFLPYLDTITPYKAGDDAKLWVKLPGNFETEIVHNLKEFAKELCALLFNEDYKEASWNYDAYFLKLAKDLMND